MQCWRKPCWGSVWRRGFITSRLKRLKWCLRRWAQERWVRGVLGDYTRQLLRVYRKEEVERERERERERVRVCEREVVLVREVLRAWHILLLG